MNNTIFKKAHKAMFSLGMLAVIVAVPLTGMPGPAVAAAFFDNLVDNTLNFFEDEDRETFIDMDEEGTEGHGALSVGDIALGWVRIDDRTLPAGYRFPNDELFAIFSIEVTEVQSIEIGTNISYRIIFGPTPVSSGLDIGSLMHRSVPVGSVGALYENVGINLISTSPTDVDGDGRLTMLDFISRIAARDLDLVFGIDPDTDDHWVTLITVPTAADPVADLSLLQGIKITNGTIGENSFHAGLSILVNNSDFFFAKNVEDFVETPETPTLHEITIQNGDISGAADLFYPDEGNPFFASVNEKDVYGVSTNADFSVYPSTAKVGACRMTGGNATVFEILGSDGTATWSYEFKGPSEGDGDKVTTGGQINAPSGNNPPSGHWEHTLHGGADGVFSFHVGTSSAPAGTQISTVECADPGWCVQARCAPFKQLFWTGIGNFANQRFDYTFTNDDGSVCPVVKGNRGTQHFVKVMIGDFGENNRPTREAALDDANPASCDWYSKLPGGMPPGPWNAADAVLLDSEPDDQFGDKGGQVCDTCPDYYQIEIHCTPDSTSDVIYSFAGYLGGGNYQIHPETGEQCPVVEELVPELFESSDTRKGGGKKK